MLRFSVLLAICAIIALVQATSYKLQDDYTDNFFDMFDFFTGPDPTLGYTDYLTYDNATASGLIRSTNPPTWGVDDNNVLDPSNTAGRPSVRLTSKNTYNHGLFILDLAHMPNSACGVWPAFWTFGQTATWPTSGEIDIIEFVNAHSTNLMTLHTADGCSIAGDESLMSGTLESNVCDVSQGNGCSIEDNATYSAGNGFNSVGGGVYAMEWTSDAIQVWFFPSGYVPECIENGTPDVANFGEPVARFAGSCDIDSHFYDHAIIFDLTFCGSWAGETFTADGCPQQGSQDSWGSCVTYVAENPNAFDNSYWQVNSLKVYQIDSSSPSAAVSTGTSATPVGSTSSIAIATQSIALGASTTPSSLVARTSTAVSTSSIASTTTAQSTYTNKWHHGPPAKRHVHGPRDW